MSSTKLQLDIWTSLIGASDYGSQGPIFSRFDIDESKYWTLQILFLKYQITHSSAWALLLALMGSAIPTGGNFLPKILADLPTQSFLLSYGRCSKMRSVSIMKMHNPRNPTILRITLLIRDSSDNNSVFCLKLSDNPGKSMVAFWEVKGNQTQIGHIFPSKLVNSCLTGPVQRVELLSINVLIFIPLGHQQ